MCPAAPNDHPVTRQAPRIAYLGPQGSFSEQAILSDPTFVGMELEPASSIVDAVQRVVDGAVAAAVVPLENAVAGRIEATERAIAGASRLVIEREITIAVHLDLLGIAGAELDSIRRVLSFPAATAQCRRFLDERLPAAVIESADSTSSAARRVAGARVERRSSHRVTSRRRSVRTRSPRPNDRERPWQLDPFRCRPAHDRLSDA